MIWLIWATPGLAAIRNVAGKENIMTQVKMILGIMTVGSALNVLNMAMADEYVIREKTILRVGVPIRNSTRAEIASADDNGVHIVLYGMWHTRVFFFAKRPDGWMSASTEVPILTEAGLLSQEPQPQVYTIVNKPVSGTTDLQTIVSVFQVDLDTSEFGNPHTMITIPTDKIFSSELGKKGQQLFPLPDKTGRYLLLGECSQSKWDPLAIAGHIISGGHSCFSNWPFLAEISESDKAIFYKWPVNYATNEVMWIRQAVPMDNKVHLVGIWYKEYMPSRYRLEYSVCDRESGKWSKPEVVYKQTRSPKYLSTSPSILVDEENVVIAWCLGDNDDLGPGIFVRSKVKNAWTKTEKVSPCFDDPLLAKDNKGNPSVFWRTPEQGIYVSSWNGNKWAAPCLLLQDDKIHTAGTAWDIKSDGQGKYHVVYCQRHPDRPLDSEEHIVYVYIEHRDSTDENQNGR